MAKRLLVRHAKSVANLKDDEGNRIETAFGNVDAPLAEEGIAQIPGLRRQFINDYGIDPETYEPPVLCSRLRRSQETAERVGFKNIEIHRYIDESNFDREADAPEGAVEKHAAERWGPDETIDRLRKVFYLLRSGHWDYTILFGHGLLWASGLVLLEREAHLLGEPFPHPFLPNKGFVPRTATITVAEI